MIFKNRIHAGKLLASKLHKYKNKKAVVLALPRGGVPLGAEVAKELNVSFDVLIVRKIGAPFNSELAVGAICENDEPIFNSQILSKVGLEPDDMNRAVAEEKKEVQRQIKEFRLGKPMSDTTEKTVILVDDGLATGATIKAAVKYLKKSGAAKIVVAVPVAPSSTARAIRDKVDELIVLEERENLVSVGQWYSDFSQVSDNEVITLLQSSQKKMAKQTAMPRNCTVEIKIDKVKLEGELTVFSEMKAVIIFAHGSRSSRKSPRNLQVANDLNSAGFGTLLFDLLTDHEAKDRTNVFNIEFLSDRLASVTEWLLQQQNFQSTKIGFFGASTGAAAALQAAAKQSVKEHIFSIVSRGGRPDLAGEEALMTIQIPTLLIVGSNDSIVINLNRKAQKKLSNSKLSIIAGATHLFEEPGALEEVSRQAAQWFKICLADKKTEASVFNKKNMAVSTENINLEDAIDKAMIKINQEEDLDARCP